MTETEDYIPNSSAQQAALDALGPATQLAIKCTGAGLPFPNIGAPVRLSPGEPAPANACAACADLWAKGVARARRAGVHQQRAIACPCGDDTGRILEVAYLRHSPAPGQPAWVAIPGVPVESWNETYFHLLLHDAADYLAISTVLTPVVTEAAQRGAVEAARLWRDRVAKPAGALVLAALGGRR